MLVPSPKWLDTGSNAWQMAAATFVGLQSIPGLVILYGGIVKKKWALNSAFMAMYAFAAVMIVWVLWGYNMAFGPQWFPFLGHTVTRTIRYGIPAGAGDHPRGGLGHAGSGLPDGDLDVLPVRVRRDHRDHHGGLADRPDELQGLGHLRSAVDDVHLHDRVFQHLGRRMAGRGGGGGLLRRLCDPSRGRASSGFVAAAADRAAASSRTATISRRTASLLALAGAGILWLGWNGFNGGDPYFANADASAAILNTNLCTCVSLLVWTIMDSFAYGKPSVVGAINGMIAGLVGITPGAGYVNGWGAMAIGILTGIIPWIMMNKVQTSALFRKVDDTLSVLSTHGVAGLIGGLSVGIFACGDMLMYIGTDKEAPGVSITGLLYGDSGNQLLMQVYAALFIIALNAVGTAVILKVISIFVALRMDETTLGVGDDAVHGETAYNFGEGEEAAPAE